MIAIIYTLVTCHLLMAMNTLYIHRHHTHRAIQWNPFMVHFWRVIAWFDGIHTKEWVAQHRRHHMYTDVPGDPHSPNILGLWNIAVKGFFINIWARYGSTPWNTAEELRVHGRGTPDDWLEKNVYTRFLRAGPLVLLLIDVLLFQWVGVAIWIIQMCWTPLLTTTVVTGLLHHKRRHNWPGASVFLIGEEYHINHHTRAANARFGKYDLGYFYIWTAQKLGLCRIL